MGESATSLAGQTTFPELAALIRLSDLVVTNNTGPMHVAAALKTPVVALFALTNPPDQWQPWQVPHRLLYEPTPCALCYTRHCPLDHQCLAGVPPAAVLRAAAGLLEETVSRRRTWEQPALQSPGDVEDLY
jgi:ADP-heptose:LPS heptosyltransferase